MSTPNTFEVGTTYSTRSICDYDCIISVTIASRTKCFVTTTDGKRFKVGTTYSTGSESVMPWGSYSMAPMITADDAENVYSSPLPLRS